jgi:hypothetical protein
MRTVKSHNIAIMVQELSLLGLVGNDAIRLARLIATGNYQHMHNACRETVNAGKDFLFRFAGSDLVVFGPKGYAVIDHMVGWVDMSYSYAYRHTSFAEHTWRYRDEPLNLQDLQENEQAA